MLNIIKILCLSSLLTTDDPRKIPRALLLSNLVFSLDGRFLEIGATVGEDRLEQLRAVDTVRKIVSQAERCKQKLHNRIFS